MAPTLSLPQHATPAERDARRDQLAARQARYVYKSPPTIPGVAFLEGPVDRMPDEVPKLIWALKVALVTARVTLNRAFTPKALWESLHYMYDAVFSNLGDLRVLKSLHDRFAAPSVAAATAPDPHALARSRTRFRDARIKGSLFEERADELEEYRALYRIIPMPYIGNIFLEDRVFARLRVAGYNPISLFRVDAPDAVPFSVEHGRMPAVGDTLAAAAAEQRLYALDFAHMGGVSQSKTKPEQLIVPAKALFAVAPDGTGLLHPVAIELPDGVVYPPREDESFSTRWAIAKMVVNNCDALHHELVAHLGRTHLLVEPFVAATMRQLPATHPVHALLRPHFEGTVFINDTASRQLVAPGGDVDTVFAGDISAVMEWCAGVVLNNPFNASMPDVELAARGMDAPVLSSPYRDDALEHFDALLEWVGAFLSTYYAGDADLAKDVELQAWVAELVDEQGGRLKDFGDNGDGQVLSVRYLTRALAFVIFSASVQHAAVNFPQQSLMSYAPAVAGALYSDPVHKDEAYCLERWSEMLTPPAVAADQIDILNVIGCVYHTQLGRYRRGEMPPEQRIQNALAQYRQRLAAIDRRITQRETAEELKYEYMRPCNVPQSINI